MHGAVDHSSKPIPQMTSSQSNHLHLLHVYKAFHLHSRGGGVERYIDSLATEQRFMGFSVSVMALSGDESSSNANSAAPHYSVVYGGYRRLWKSIGEADLIHIHGPR